MLPDELRQLRARIFHSASEFAKLLGELRGADVSAATVQGWEVGRNNKPVPVWKTDLYHIEQATKPITTTCICGAPTIVRKNNSDLCATCATPRNWATAKKLAAVA